MIVRNYKAGETIKATIKFSGNHGGVISFRLCPSDNGATTWDCFVQHEIAVTEAGGKTNCQEPWSDAEHHDGDVTVHVKLSAGLTCKQCVFQWHWSGALVLIEQLAWDVDRNRLILHVPISASHKLD